MSVYLFNLLLVLIGIPFDQYFKNHENVNSIPFLNFVILNLDESTFQTVNSFNAGCAKIPTPFYVPVTIIPEKGLPTPFREPSRVITTYYPHKLLELYSNFKEEFLVKKEFFLTKDLLLKILFLLFLFFIIFNIKKKNKNKIKERLQSKNKYFVKTMTFFLTQNVLNNEYIYSDKIQGRRSENEIIYSCGHMFLDVKKNDILILTKDFLNLQLYVGMKAVVKKVLLCESLEVVFFHDPTLANPWARGKLLKYETVLIKENQFLLPK